MPRLLSLYVLNKRQNKSNFPVLKGTKLRFMHEYVYTKILACIYVCKTCSMWIIKGFNSELRCLCLVWDHTRINVCQILMTHDCLHDKSFSGMFNHL